MSERQQADYSDRAIDYWTVYRTIESNPGRKLADIARLLDVRRCLVLSALCVMEGEGLLISEDDDGRLFSFCVAERGTPIRNGGRI